MGRALPTATNETPKAYRMKLWATDEVRAKSKFWYVEVAIVMESWKFFLLSQNFSGCLVIMRILPEEGADGLDEEHRR